MEKYSKYLDVDVSSYTYLQLRPEMKGRRRRRTRRLGTTFQTSGNDRCVRDLKAYAESGASQRCSNC